MYMVIYVVNKDNTKSFKTNKELLLMMLNDLGEDERALATTLQLQLEFEELAGNKEITVIFKEYYDKFVNLLKKRIN